MFKKHSHMFKLQVYTDQCNLFFFSFFLGGGLFCFVLFSKINHKALLEQLMTNLIYTKQYMVGSN